MGYKKIIILFVFLFIIAGNLLWGDDPGTTDPLNGEREVVVEQAFRLSHTGWYWGVYFGGIACSGGESPLDRWAITHHGGNVFSAKSTFYTRKNNMDAYLFVDPNFQGYKLGVTQYFDKRCYFEMVPTSNGKFAIKSQANNKFLAPVYDRERKLNMLDAIKDKIDSSCEMVTVPIKTVTLGDPDHWYTADIKPILVLGEPPKHIDYIADADGKKVELNVSRTSGFYSVFKDMTQKEISSSNTHTSDWNFGVKVSASTKADKGIPIVADIKANVSVSAGYMYNKHKEDIDKDYKSVTTKEELKAVNSDFLVFNKSAVHIWSYPIIGETDVRTTDKQKGQLYYQIVVPDPDFNNPYYLSGTVAEWYQPVHLNGNAFSYPWHISQIQKFEKTEKLNLLTDPKSIATDNNQMSFYVEWNEVTEKGDSITTSHKFETDESIGVSFLVKGVGGSTTVKTHYDQTWKTLTTSSTKLTQSKGITISKEPLPGASFYAYEIHPMIFTKGTEKKEGSKIDVPTGGMKLNYLVDFPEDYTSYKWWRKDYSNKPDIALNLPCQWRMTDSTGKNWKFDPESINFSLMKGLFVEDSSGKRFFYSIEEGEPVKVTFRVYNFSFCEARDILVKLEAQKSTDGEKWGKRFLVGTNTIPSIRAFGNTDYENNWDYVSVDFDTTGKGGDYYKFWVVLNSDKKFQELPNHGYKEHYSNNEGFFPIPLTIIPKKKEKTGNKEIFKRSRISLSSIMVSNQKPAQGDQVKVSLWVGVQDENASPVFVSFYENRPGQKKILFDMEVVPFIKKGGRFFVKIPYDTYGKKGDWEISAVVHSQGSVIDSSSMGKLTLQID